MDYKKHIILDLEVNIKVDALIGLARSQGGVLAIILIIKTLRMGIEDMNCVSNKTMWRSLVSNS
jgi:hypothetical protein